MQCNSWRCFGKSLFSEIVGIEEEKKTKKTCPARAIFMIRGRIPIYIYMYTGVGSQWTSRREGAGPPLQFNTGWVFFLFCRFVQHLKVLSRGVPTHTYYILYIYLCACTVYYRYSIGILLSSDLLYNNGPPRSHWSSRRFRRPADVCVPLPSPAIVRLFAVDSSTYARTNPARPR